jgi:single-strand DNA-binding protein
MNIFNTIARLGADAELRYLPNNDAVMQFRVAFDSGYGDKKVTTWMQCDLYGKRATDKLAGYLTKGSQVGLSGEIKIDEWTANNGLFRRR